MVELKLGWHRPNEEQSARGVIAVLYEPCYCDVEGLGKEGERIRVVNYYGGYTDNKTKQKIEQTLVYGIEYDTERMNRRIKQGGNLPKWVIPIAKNCARIISDRTRFDGRFTIQCEAVKPC